MTLKLSLKGQLAFDTSVLTQSLAVSFVGHQSFGALPPYPWYSAPMQWEDEYYFLGLS